jgi:hypothetical protein
MSKKKYSHGVPSKEARERYNEKRKQERGRLPNDVRLEEVKPGDPKLPSPSEPEYKRDKDGNVVTDRYGNPLYNAKIADKPKKSRGAGRTRNFATVVYPESAPENWTGILAGHLVPAFISPLHQDIDPHGEVKKEHYHVMIMFEGVKTDEQAGEILKSIGGVGVERLNSLRGYARYLCHLDDPSKVQYPPEEVVALCGADYFSAIGLPTDKYKAVGEMMDFCNEQGIYGFASLLMYAKEHRYDWFRVLNDSSTYVIGQFLKSKRWEDFQEDR